VGVSVPGLLGQGLEGKQVAGLTVSSSWWGVGRAGSCIPMSGVPSHASLFQPSISPSLRSSKALKVSVFLINLPPTFPFSRLSRRATGCP
jgi:hypothetical protein